MTDAIYEHTQKIERYFTLDVEPIDLDQIGEQPLAGMTVRVLDPVADYAELMEGLFDFDAIRALFSSGNFRMRFDAMHAVTGPMRKRSWSGGSARSLVP